MDYNQALDYLYNALPAFEKQGTTAYKPGLDTTMALAEAFGNPHVSIPAVHIAGTNGKGSTSHTLAAVFQSAGLKVGLYTSPHLVDFRERIRVNGQMIPQAEVIDFIKRYLEMPPVGDHTPTFFELTTVMALEHFARQKVDIAVIETGLGGRLDSTNIITPHLSVITNISPDHTALLGDTLTAIAAEKAGIIKPGVPAVVGEADDPAVRQIFADRAQAVGAPIRFAQDNPLWQTATETPEGYLLRHTRWGDIATSLPGQFQLHNAATVLTALKTLCPDISPEAVAQGFAQVCTLTGLRGRWTVAPGLAPCHVVYDTGHNPGAWKYLHAQFRKILADRHHSHLTLLLGFVADKDLDAILRYIPRESRCVFVTPPGHRGRPATDCAAIARQAGINATADTRDVGIVFRDLADQAAPEDTIFVGGSNYLVGQWLQNFDN